MKKSWLLSKRTILATAVSAAILSGCGGGSDSDDSNEVSNFTITALDGYLHNASISIDSNDNGVCDTDIGETDENGQILADVKYKDKPICVTATVGKTIDMTRGLVSENFTLRAPSGSNVVNPLTNLVVEKLEADSTLTLEAAQTAVIKTLTDNGIQVDRNEAFGDYLSETNSPEEALKSRQLEIIGEVLVDNDKKANLDNKLKIVKDVINVLKLTGNQLDNVMPKINYDVNGNVVGTSINRYPASKGAKNLKFATEKSQVGTTSIDLVNDYGLSFTDDDGDSFTYKVSTTSEYQHGVQINDQGVLSGIKHDKAGVYTFYIFAVDNHGAKSKPVELTVTFTSSNKPPQLDATAKATFEQTIQSLDFTKGVEFPAQTINLDGLFVDEDVASLRISTDTDAVGLTAAIEQGQLVISGTPTAEGQWNVNVWAVDGVNQEQASVTVLFNVKPSDIAVVHPLENQVFYFVDNEHSDNQPTLSCQSLKLENNTVYFADPSLVNNYTCNEPTFEVGSYTINGATIQTTINDGQGDEIDNIEVLKSFDLDQGHLIKVTSQTRHQNGVAEKWLTELFVSSKHVEATLNMANSGVVYRTLLWMNDRYIDPAVGAQLNGFSALNSQPIVKVSFAPALSCADLSNIYSTFYFSNENRETTESNNCVVDTDTGQPTIIFNDLNGMAESNLVNGKAYTVTSKLTPAYVDKMAPLAMRVKFNALEECKTENDTKDQTDTPLSLTASAEYLQVVAACKADKSTTINIESVVTTFVNQLTSKSFILKNDQENYVFYQKANGERSVRVQDKSSAENTFKDIAIAKWDFIDGMITIFDATEPSDGSPMNIKDTIELTSWNYDDKTIAVKKLFQNAENDVHGLGNWSTHGVMSSEIYLLESFSN